MLNCIPACCSIILEPREDSSGHFSHQSCCFLCSASSYIRRSIFSCFLPPLREREDTFRANSLCFSSFSLCVGGGGNQTQATGVKMSVESNLSHTTAETVNKCERENHCRTLKWFSFRYRALTIPNLATKTLINIEQIVHKRSLRIVTCKWFLSPVCAHGRKSWCDCQTPGVSDTACHITRSKS